MYANPAFEQLSGYTFPELAAMESLLRARRARASARRPRGARAARASGDSVDTAYALAMRRRDGGRVTLELGGRAARDRRTADRRQLVVVVRDVTARRRAEAERERLLARSALLAEASELFDQSLDEERDAAQRRARCACATSPTPA